MAAVNDLRSIETMSSPNASPSQMSEGVIAIADGTNPAGAATKRVTCAVAGSTSATPVPVPLNEPHAT